MDGFTSCDVHLDDGLTIRAATAGRGTPLLLLLHGHPQTLATWRKVAPILAESFSVVACDLRGYGDSSKPDGGIDHVARASRLALLDIAPTATMYARTDKAFATRYFWRFFLIQPAPFPERMIGLDPEYFLPHHIDGQLKVEGATDPAAFAEYLRRYRNPATIHAICEDYRAAAGIDLEHDAEDGERRIAAPLLALWGARGTVWQLYDVLATWREKADDVSGRALDCGHSPQEECPDALLCALLPFFEGAEDR